MKKKSEWGFIGFKDVRIRKILLSINLMNPNSDKRELEMPLFYDNNHIVSRRVDFLVEESVMVELKALIKLEDVHLDQGLNYLVAYNVNLGLLLNFGAQSLGVKRLRHPKNKENPIIH